MIKWHCHVKRGSFFFRVVWREKEKRTKHRFNLIQSMERRNWWLEQIAFKFNRRFTVNYQQKVWQQHKNEKTSDDALARLIFHEHHSGTCKRMTITWSYLLPTQSSFCSVKGWYNFYELKWEREGERKKERYIECNKRQSKIITTKNSCFVINNTLLSTNIPEAIS